jgi:peptidoglycan/LPS O-acetylase OafA/YrhL
MLFAAATTLLTLNLAFYSGILAADNSYHTLIAMDHFWIMVLTIALATGILINIFLFKHRSVQFRICIFALFVECLIIFIYFGKTNEYSRGSFNIWAVLHLLIIIFLIMAAVGIYKDSKLIRDSNRLR